MIESHRYAAAFCACLSILAGFQGSAFAQQERPIFPPSAKPDVRLDQLRPPEEQAPGQAPAVPEGALTQAPEGAEAIRFVLDGLLVEGVTAYAPEKIEPFATEVVGREISLAEVYAIAASVQQMYREDGYFLSRVIVPPQVIDDGRVQITVLEGYVGDVVYQGDVGPVRELIESYVDQVLLERPLRIKTLERYLLLAKDIPGVDVTGTLRPSTDQLGAAQLVVTAQRKAFDAMALVDNIGSTFTGQWEVVGSVSANAFTRYGDSATVTALVSDPANGFGGNSENQRVVQFGGSFRPDKRGTYVNLLASYGDSNPGGLISRFEFQSKTLLLSASGGYPLIRSRDRNLAVELGFDYTDSSTDVFDDIKFSRDHLRVLHVDALMDFRDKWRGSNLLGLHLRQGLPILGASKSGDEDLSRPNGSGVFTSLRMGASRYQPLFGRFSVVGRVEAQYAFETLLSDEEFDVGGFQFGRGYDPKELSGDHGVGVTGEVHYTRGVGKKFLDRYQLFGFYDFGSVWERSTDLSASLASAGGGIRGWLGKDFSIALQVAKPLTRDSQRADDTKDAQVLFRALAQF